MVMFKIIQVSLFFLNTIFVLNHMYPETSEETSVIIISMNMGYAMYPILPGLELTTVPSLACAKSTRPQL